MKTASVKEAREVGKVAETRGLPDGKREFLGKEAEKIHKPLDVTTLPKISNEMRELKTIEDVRELLNKNK